MTPASWALLVAFLVVAALCAKPLGIYIANVMEGRSAALRVGAPVEALIYRLCGVDPKAETGWKSYALAFLVFNTLGLVLLYVLQRVQVWLPLNPQKFANVSPDSSFNTAVSFVTNTNWQGYSGESTMSYLTQMAGLAVQNFLSAASGIVVAIALIRGLARHSAKTIGNFWVDLTRCTLYILLPLAVVIALMLSSQGVVQNFSAYKDVTTLETVAYQQPKTDAAGNPVKDAAGNPVLENLTTQTQTLPMGPIASQEAIKQLGTNGGGIFNANSAHPFENPGPITNLIEMVSMNVLGYACVIAFGRVVLARRDARALVAVMAALVFAATAALYATETRPAPALTAVHADAAVNMEGKEVRFGAPSTAIWTAYTTGASDGGVNAMHDSLMPLGGGVAMFMIQLGEILPGGVGSGLYGMVVMALIAVFVAGLMVGRTPEYLGKKVEAREIKYAMLAVLILPLSILGFTAVAAVLPAGLAGLLNHGPHGLSEILYAYSSATGNNGSAFAGLSANTPFWNTTLGVAMLLGRFAYAIPVLAIAGSLAAKPRLEASTGAFPTDGLLFVGLLTGVILIMGGLQFFPAQALGPIVEHFQALPTATAR